MLKRFYDAVMLATETDCSRGGTAPIPTYLVPAASARANSVCCV